MSDIEIIQKQEEKIEKWPWTSEFLKGKNSELNFTEMQIEEVTKRSLAQFNEISKKSAESYSDEVRRKWEKQVEDEYLDKIIADVKDRPYWQENEKTVQGIVSNFSNDNEKLKENVEKELEVAENIVVENIIINQQSVSEKENEGKSDNKINPIIAPEVVVVANDIVEPSQVKEDVVTTESSIDDLGNQKKVDEVKSTSIDILDNSKVDNTSEDIIEGFKSANNKLTEFQIESLSNNFKSYGIFSGDLKERVKKLAEEAKFDFGIENEFVSKTNDDGSINITFNGDCKKRHYVEVSNNCYLGIDYDSKSGAVNILNDSVFYDNGEAGYKEISLKSGSKELENTLESERDARRVQDKLKGLNLIVCSNPNSLEGVSEEEQPKRQVAAMSGGKTQGAKLTFGQKLGFAAGLLVIGAAAALTGVGIVFGGAAIVAAGALAVSAVAGVATTAASAVAGVASAASATVAGTATNSVGAVLTIAKEVGTVAVSTANVAGTATNSAGAVVTIAKEVGTVAVSTANTVASHVTNIANNAVSTTSNTTTSDINSMFDKIRDAIANTARGLSSIVASNAPNSADKIASVANNLTDKAGNVLSNGVEKIANNAVNSESIAKDALSGLKKAANSKYTIPVSSGFAVGAAAATIANAANEASKNDGIAR